MSEIDDLKRDQFLYERDKKIDSGGPAFPMPHEQMQTGVWGLTKREWFAGMALQGMIASGDANDNQIGVIAQEAYKLADSMIRAGKGEK